MPVVGVDAEWRPPASVRHGGHPKTLWSRVQQTATVQAGAGGAAGAGAEAGAQVALAPAQGVEAHTPRQWPVSVLQLGFRNGSSGGESGVVFLVDMLTLHCLDNNPAALHTAGLACGADIASTPGGHGPAVGYVARAVRWLFENREVAKLGFGLENDVSRLASSYVHARAWQTLDTSILTVRPGTLILESRVWIDI